MRQVYFVTEGVTDQILLEGLIEEWLAGEDFLANRIQPPSSEYANGIETRLSEGWRGVVGWVSGETPALRASRDEIIRKADLLVVHVDADVGRDSQFRDPAYISAIPPVDAFCEHVRQALIEMFGGTVPEKAVLCIPAQDLEAWAVASLHPDLADANAPIDCFGNPGSILANRNPYRLLRYKDGKLRKLVDRYKNALHDFVDHWSECTLRTSQAMRFETEVAAVLQID